MSVTPSDIGRPGVNPAPLFASTFNPVGFISLGKLVSSTTPGLYNGLYVAVGFSAATVANLAAYIQSLGLKTPSPPEELHTTVVYSKKSVQGWVAKGDISPPIVASGPFKLELFGKEKDCLVLTYDCPSLKARFEQALAMGATTDYPVYRAHVTLGYQCQGMDITNLPLPDFTLEIVEEYARDIVENWSSKVGIQASSEHWVDMDWAIGLNSTNKKDLPLALAALRKVLHKKGFVSQGTSFHKDCFGEMWEKDQVPVFIEAHIRGEERFLLSWVGMPRKSPDEVTASAFPEPSGDLRFEFPMMDLQKRFKDASMVDFNTFDTYMKANNFVDNKLIERYLRVRQERKGEKATVEERDRIRKQTIDTDMFDLIQRWMIERWQRTSDGRQQGNPAPSLLSQQSIFERISKIDWDQLSPILRPDSTIVHTHDDAEGHGDAYRVKASVDESFTEMAIRAFDRGFATLGFAVTTDRLGPTECRYYKRRHANAALMVFHGAEGSIIQMLKLPQENREVMIWAPKASGVVEKSEFPEYARRVLVQLADLHRRGCERN